MSPGDDEHDLGVGPVERNSAPGGADATDAVGGPDAVVSTASVSPSEAVDAPGDALGLDEISAGLAAGSLSAAEARTLLIDRVVAAQLPAGADAAMAAEVRADVAAALEGDPTLEALLDPRS